MFYVSFIHKKDFTVHSSHMTYCSKSCTHTKQKKSKENGEASWWKLEFSTDVQIDWLYIWNRDKAGINAEKRIDGVKVFFLFNTYFTSVYPTAMWLQCNRPITGAEGSYKASDG